MTFDDIDRYRDELNAVRRSECEDCCYTCDSCRRKFFEDEIIIEHKYQLCPTCLEEEKARLKAIEEEEEEEEEESTNDD